MRAERFARMQERFGGDDEGGRGPGRGMTGQGMGRGMGEGMRDGAGPSAMMSEEDMRGRMGRGAGPGSENDFMERLQRRAAAGSARADELTRLADAMQPLWDSLDERQRALLPVLVRGTEGLVSPGRGGWRGGERGMRGESYGNMRGNMHGRMHGGMHGRGWN